MSKGARVGLARALAVKPGLVGNGLGFAAGVGLLFLLQDLPPLWLLLALAGLLGALAWRWPLFRPLAFAAAGLGWAHIQVCHILCEPFPEDYTREDLQVVGTVASLPQDREQGSRFLFRVESARHDGEEIGFQGLVRLSWYREPPELRAGERWWLNVRLKPPHGFANPGGFDYERWLFLQGVKATGYVRPAPENQRVASGPGAYFVDRWRQHLRAHIAGILGDSTGASLIQALVLGDRSGLGRDQWDALTRTGTNHLIAISGLHIGLVAAFVFFLSRWVWSRSAGLTLAVAAPRAAAVAAFAAALAYSALAGFAISTQRALIMLAVVLGALLFSRTIRPVTGITAALVGVLVLDPQAVLSYGFWLSFGAVAVLLFALGSRPAASGPWSRWGRAQWVVAVGLLPLLLLLFGRASLIAPAVNLIAVPLFSLVLLPAVLVASLLSLVPGFEVLLAAMARVLEWGWDLLEAAASWPWAATSVAERPPWVWLAAFAGTALLLAPRGLPGRWLGLLFLLPLPLVRPPVLDPGQAQFTLLDVGQGLSAVVRTRDHSLLYDTGPVFASGFNTGTAVVLPFLRRQGVDRIDTLVLSHADRDHAGGFQGLAGGVDIGRLLSGEPGELPGVGAEPCRAGDSWTWDGVRFDLLHPTSTDLKGNDSSCVLRVRTDGASVLLTGDIGSGEEGELAAVHGSQLRSTILVASHHGSATSTSEVFLDAVSPRFVLYSTGYADRFGFPAEEVRTRVLGRGAQELDTADCGAISFRLDRKGFLGPGAHRLEERRLWTHRTAPPTLSF